jgi:hypothetical protein
MSHQGKLIQHQKTEHVGKGLKMGHMVFYHKLLMKSEGVYSAYGMKSQQVLQV